MPDLVVARAYWRKRACRRRQAFVVVPFALFFPRAAVPLPRWLRTTKKRGNLAQGCLATVGRVDVVFLNGRLEFRVLKSLGGTPSNKGPPIDLQGGGGRCLYEGMLHPFFEAAASTKACPLRCSFEAAASMKACLLRCSL